MNIALLSDSHKMPNLSLFLFKKIKQRMNMLDNKSVLDVCCGGKMFWFDKNNSNALFLDNRTVEDVLCDGRSFKVIPDEIMDFRQLDIPDNTFPLVVFDPPHFIKLGELKKIMGFPEDYVLKGNQSEQKKFIGNAVEVNMATALCVALYKQFINIEKLEYVGYIKEKRNRRRAI